MNGFLKITLVFMLLLFTQYAGSLKAQSDSTAPHFRFDGYIDVYFSYDYNRPASGLRPAFLYSYNHHDDPEINLALFHTAYDKKNLRCNLALMFGTYSRSNLASEKKWLRYIYEANIGLAVGKKKNTWLDAGVFPSHIGFESAIGKDCWTLSRSIMAENTPYYESGIRLSWSPEKNKWTFRILLLNGWQRIGWKNENRIPAAGTQVTYTPNEKITLNSSSFIGHVLPDSSHCIRYFHNAYAVWQLHSRFGITAGIDNGMQKNPSTDKFDSWINPTIIVRGMLTKKIFLACRYEYYYDPGQIIINTSSPNGFRSSGFSANLDYRLNENILFRCEGRSLKSADPVFVRNYQPVNDNFCFMVSASCAF